MKSRKKNNQRKWESSHYQSPEEYAAIKKEKEFLTKYRHIAGEYLEDWELSEIFKKNNFDEEQISKELNKILLGDDYKWKEIKNGKPVTTRSTDQVRKKQKYYKAEKTYNNNIYEKTEENRNESNNKRKIKSSYHKNLNDFYHYVSKKPKRPFQKCIEVPSDYLPLKNNNNFIQDNKNIINTEDNIINNNNDENNNNKIIPSKSANNIIKIDNENKIINELENNTNINNENKKTIKKALPINMNMNLNNKIEETKNNENDKKISDEEQRKIILIKGEVFKNLKRLKTNTETKFKDNKNRQKEIIYKQNDSSEKRIETSGGVDSDYSLSNKDIKNDKALQKKYLKIFLGNMNHYSKKQENNIKRATSKDSETSDDRPDTIKRNNKRNNIPTSSNIIQKKSRVVNINKNSNNKNNINKNLRKAYELDQRDREIEPESKVVNLTINSCYDNPYRDQYLKFINEKRKKNPGKIVELIIPQFNNMFMPPYPFPYQYPPPYLNQNMLMYPQNQLQPPISIPNQQNLNLNYNQKINNLQQMPNMNQYQPQMSIPMNPQINKQINSPINSHINLQLSPQVNRNIINNSNNNSSSRELSNHNYSNKEINSDNQINNMSDN